MKHMTLLELKKIVDEEVAKAISREQYLARKEAVEVIEDLCIKRIDSEPTKTELDCIDAISREEVKELLDEYYAELTLDETALKSNTIAIKVTRHIINDIEALPSVNPTRPKTDAIPIEWLKEKLVNHPELSYSLTDGIINVLNFWESEKESDSDV